jgi:hypothetical protein
MYCGQMGIDYIVDYLQINFKNLGGFNECLLPEQDPVNTTSAPCFFKDITVAAWPGQIPGRAHLYLPFTSSGVLVAMPFPQESRKVGLLICECGGSAERMTEIANNMGVLLLLLASSRTSQLQLGLDKYLAGHIYIFHLLLPDEMTPITKTSGGVLVAMPFPQESRKVGLLICECGGSAERMTAPITISP